MAQNVDYDYDDVIQFCQGSGQTSINDLANSLNELSSRMETCQDAFHSKDNQLVIGEIYNAFSSIIGSTSTKSGVTGLDLESAKIINVCYSEAMRDKNILEGGALGGSDNSGANQGVTPPPSETPAEQAPTPTPQTPGNNIPGTLSPGTTESTFPAQAYNLSPEEYRILCATVYAEAAEGNSYTTSDTMGVTSVILNRVEAGNWGGSDVVSVVSAKGQFSGYGEQNQKFAAAMNNPNIISPEMRAAIDRTLAGERNTRGQSFSGNGTHNSFR